MLALVEIGQKWRPSHNQTLAQLRTFRRLKLQRAAQRKPRRAQCLVCATAMETLRSISKMVNANASASNSIRVTLVTNAPMALQDGHDAAKCATPTTATVMGLLMETNG